MEEFIKVSFAINTITDQVIAIHDFVPTSMTLVSDLPNMNPQYFLERDFFGKLYLCTQIKAGMPLKGEFSDGTTGYVLLAKQFVDGKPFAA